MSDSDDAAALRLASLGSDVWHNQPIRSRICEAASGSTLVKIAQLDKASFRSAMAVIWKGRRAKPQTEDDLDTYTGEITCTNRHVICRRAVQCMSTMWESHAEFTIGIMRYPKLSFFCTTQAEIDGEIIRDDHGDITLIRGFFRRFDSYAIPQALEEVEDWTEVLPPSIPLQVVLDRISIMTVDQLHVTIALLKEHKFRFDHLDVCGKILADLDLESAMRDLAGHAHDSATISLSLANVKYRGCDIETALSILRRSSTIFRGLPVRRITGIYDSVINVIRISADEHSLLRQVQHVDLDCTFPDDGAVDAWDDVVVPLFTSISASDWPLHPSTITIRLEREYTADLPIHLRQYPVLANTRWLFKLAEACLLVTGPLGRVELIYRGVFVADLTAERLVQAELQASREEIPDDPDWGYYRLSSWKRNTWSDSGEDAWSSGTSARSNSKPYDKYDHDDDRSVDTETGRPDASFSDAGYDSDSDEDDDSKRDFDRDMMLFAPDMIEYETPYEFDIAMSATLTEMIQVMMRD